MVTRALIAQRAVDHHEIGRASRGSDLPRRSEADQKLAPGGEQLLGHQHREGRPDDTADNPDPAPGKVECVEFGVIAGPVGEGDRRAALAQLAHEVAIRIENAAGRRLRIAEPFLSPGLSQEGGGGEHRRLRCRFVVEDGGDDHVTL